MGRKKTWQGKIRDFCNKIIKYIESKYTGEELKKVQEVLFDDFFVLDIIDYCCHTLEKNWKVADYIKPYFKRIGGRKSG